ncbi:MAG: sigma-70 family RNA polymerase sigma factor [Acidobacteria bacterium]|nr:sigma-70 family RNA polymerase sigma factor [Acidobacteriota bacterium]MBI3425347.1 sigma-70 family RNA polymerase sigma factor [Acidobacteriota bacterium]
MNRTNTQQPDFAAAALEYLDALYGFAMVLTRNRTEAEDLVQETYLRAARAFGRLLPDSNLKSWLFAIMRNIWLNHVRHAKLAGHAVELDAEAEDHWQWPAHETHDPHFVLLQKIQREQIRAAIERLPVPYREVVVLRDFEGFSYQQIATILACPAGTVMSRLGRAREQLRTLLSEWRVGTAAIR